MPADAGEQRARSLPWRHRQRTAYRDLLSNDPLAQRSAPHGKRLWVHLAYEPLTIWRTIAACHHDCCYKMPSAAAAQRPQRGDQVPLTLVCFEVSKIGGVCDCTGVIGANVGPPPPPPPPAGAEEKDCVGAED